MATTEEFLFKAVVNRLMPTSSGQIEEFSSGCQLKMLGGSRSLYKSGSSSVFQSGSQVRLQSGSRAYFSSGSTHLYESGAHIRLPVTVHTSLTKTLNNCGVAIIKAATSCKDGKVVFTIATPKGGERLDIVQATTLGVIIRGSSVAKRVYFGTTARLRFTLPKTTKSKGRAGLTLVAATSGRWYQVGWTSDVTSVITYTTACT